MHAGPVGVYTKLGGSMQALTLMAEGSFVPPDLG